MTLIATVAGTLLRVGKLRVVFVYCRNDVLYQIVLFVNEDGDAIRAGTNFGDFVVVGYIEFSKVDTMCSIKCSDEITVTQVSTKRYRTPFTASILFDFVVDIFTNPIKYAQRLSEKVMLDKRILMFTQWERRAYGWDERIIIFTVLVFFLLLLHPLRREWLHLLERQVIHSFIHSFIT